MRSAIILVIPPVDGWNRGWGLMISVSRLNNEPFYVNPDAIEFIEETPDTVISLESGRKVVVAEPAEVVIARMVEYRRRILEGLTINAHARS